MPDEAPSGPEKFGRYLLHGRIATGGMATLYLAQDQEDDPDVWLAIKRVHPHLSVRDDIKQMFMNEAKILSNLSHPNICGIADYGLHEDSPYIVMGYLHGAPLSTLIRRTLDDGRALPVDLMAYIAASTCDGLHYAHEGHGPDGPLRLVHRDISPQNIFVTFSGEVKLLDFGVAKAAGFESLTKTGTIKGKYAYMSPEQVKSEDLDRRSDIFSLGIVLWESLTGLHLFKRKNDIETIRAITKARVPAVSEINLKVPQGLDIIITKALNTDRNYRYQTADEMGAALWSYLTTTERPIGSDEVTEIMTELLPNHPTPEQLAKAPKALPKEIDTDALVASPDDTAEDDPSELDQTAPVESVSAADAQGQSIDNPTEQDMSLGDIVPALHPWTDSPPTEADATRVENTSQAPDEPAEATTKSAVPSSGDTAMRLKDRPALTPHPFDTEELGTLMDPAKEEAKDTLITPVSVSEPQTPQVFTTIPKQEISGEVSKDTPQLAPDPNPTKQLPSPPDLNRSKPPGPPSASGAVVPRSSPPRWVLLVMLASAMLLAAIFAYTLGSG